MQISDLVGQYHNASAPTPEVKGNKGVQKLVSTLKDMGAGNIFEGTVNSMKNGQVVLGLSNGQTVTARMDGKVPLQVGQSMFFQVKSNDGTQIAIRPFTMDGNSVNLTLMNALKAAGLAMDGRNLSMVNTMMEEQMPIDKNSLAQMARTLQNNPDVNVQTLVQMRKLGIPVTPEFATQFENYMNDKQAIGTALDSFMEALPEALANENLSGEQLQQMGKEVLDILTEGLPLEETAVEGELAQMGGEETAFGAQGAENAEGASVQGVQAAENAEGASAQGAQNAESASVQGAQNAEGVNAQGTQNAESASAQGAQKTENTGAQGVQNAENANAQGARNADSASAQNAEGTNAPGAQAAGNVDSKAAEQMTDKAGQSAGAASQGEAAQGAGEAFSGGTAANISGSSHTLGNLLSQEQIQNLGEQLKSLPGFEGTISAGTSSAELLNNLKEFLAGNGAPDKSSLLKLFSGKEMKALVKDVMEQQWRMKPEELTEEDNPVKKLYAKLENQLERLENAIKATGQNPGQAAQMASDIRNNVEFMNQINQNYTYVQIPLQLSGQNANGELYVYTNKKNLAEGKEDLTAFLHLDMDNLGSTDVSLRLSGKHVDTKFYFDSDESFNLVQEHLPELEKRLAAKGFNCNVSVVNDSKKVNFVDDFLKKDQPSTGQVHRYSFDMRA